MKKVIHVVSVLLLALVPQGLVAQTESVLQHVAEVHVKPGQEQLFEAAHAQRE